VKLRNLYWLVGLLWGLAIGVMAGIQGAGAAAGGLWLFVYGDSRWPESAGWIILAAGGLAATVAFAVVLIVALNHASRLDTLPVAQQRAGRRRGWVLVGLAPVILLALVLFGAL
jgi:hypothetical protein